MLCSCIYRKMCPKCCVDSSVSFGGKINYYMHNIYISITNTNLEAIKFIELTFCVFYCLYSLSLYCRLLAAVQHSSTWSFWLQSGERSAEAVRTTVFSKSTFILSYYDMVWSPWKLQWNIFFPDVESTGGGAAHHVEGVEILKNYCLCICCCGFVAMGVESEKRDTP